mmetsp:Transcript_56758/g.130544  ORF Transcript_56758/g.130544 Transcript_56758/m.130544 type:complete len:815 (+) Transcript_56758:37-2481(+)
MGNGQQPAGTRREDSRFDDDDHVVTNPRAEDIGASGKVLYRSLDRDFEIGTRKDHELGKGYAGTVRLVKHRASGQRFALKQFAKKDAGANSIEMMRNEAEVYLQVDHPHICRLMLVYEDRAAVSLIMEHCTGGELYTRLINSSGQRFTEEEAKKAALQMLHAVAYLHAHNVVHRDLKLENWLYASRDANSKLKLIDFGFSKVAEPDEQMDLACGTLLYAAPDLLGRAYTNKCDMWSLGVIVYILIIGRPPFEGKTSSGKRDNQAIVHAIRHDRLRFRRTINEEARSFISGLLNRDSQARFTATEAINHPWLQHRLAAVVGYRAETELLSAVMRWSRAKHLRQGVFRLVAQTLVSSDVDDVADAFLAFGDLTRGVITAESLKAYVSKHRENLQDDDLDRAVKAMVTQSPAPGVVTSEGTAPPRLSFTDEVHFTDFVAAIFQRKVWHYEKRMRLMFEAFGGNFDGSGYLTADSLKVIFGETYEGKSMDGVIREVDIKGNGVLDWDEFVQALQQADNPVNFLPDHERVRVRSFGDFRISRSVKVPSWMRKEWRRRVVENSSGAVSGTSQVHSCYRSFRRSSSNMGSMSSHGGSMASIYTTGSAAESAYEQQAPQHMPLRRATVDALPGRIPPGPPTPRRTLSDGNEPFYHHPDDVAYGAQVGVGMPSGSEVGSGMLDSHVSETLRKSGSSEILGPTVSFSGHQVMMAEQWFGIHDDDRRARCEALLSLRGSRKWPRTHRGVVLRTIRTTLRTHSVKKAFRGLRGRPKKSQAGPVVAAERSRRGASSSWMAAVSDHSNATSPNSSRASSFAPGNSTHE